MVEFVKFDDVEPWLVKQGRELNVALGSRIAIRALSHLDSGNYFPELFGSFENYCIWYFRRLLLPMVAAVEFDQAILDAANDSFSTKISHEIASKFQRKPFHRITNFSITSIHAGFIPAEEKPEEYSLFSAFDADMWGVHEKAVKDALSEALKLDQDVQWESFKADAAALEAGVILASDLMDRPLWPDGVMPYRFKELWLLFKEDLDEGGADWAFWIEFFERCFSGGPHNWDLYRKICLSKDIDWKAGHVEVLEAIAAIEAKYLADALPQAETLEFDTEANKVVSRPIELNAAELIQSRMNMVEMALPIALNSNCGFNSSSVGYLYISIAKELSQTDPNGMEQSLDVAAKSIRDGVASKEFEADGKLVALADVLERVVLDLRASHPEVAKAWEARNAHVLAQIDFDQLKMIAEAGPVVASIAGGNLAAELELDAKAVPVLTGEARDGALKRFLGRIARIRLIMRPSEVVKAIEANWGYKASRIIAFIGKILSWFE